ncbi:unnamed protein product [Ectocarpus sp. CCAP 1310/34]|nr:unnamed protein product [Ectocarpus sp. CCAP 1310/34]
MPAEGVTFHDEDKLAALFAWAGTKQLVRAQFPPPHTVAFGHIYHTPYLANLPPSSQQSVFQLLFDLRRATFPEGPQGTSVVIQEGGLQLPLSRAASTNDFKHDLQAPRQASSRPAHGSGEDKDLSRSAAPVSKSWKNRWGDRDSTAKSGTDDHTAPPSLREGAASEITGEGEPWGTSLPGLRRRAAITGAGVGAQKVNSAPILRLGVAGAETGVGETRLRLGVAAAGARTRAGAIAGRPALTAVAAEKGDGGQATVENHLRKEPAGPSTYALFIQKLAAAWDTQDKSSGIDRLRSLAYPTGRLTENTFVAIRLWP